MSARSAAQAHDRVFKIDRRPQRLNARRHLAQLFLQAADVDRRLGRDPRHVVRWARALLRCGHGRFRGRVRTPSPPAREHSSARAPWALPAAAARAAPPRLRRPPCPLRARLPERFRRRAPDRALVAAPQSRQRLDRPNSVAAVPRSHWRRRVRTTPARGAGAQGAPAGRASGGPAPAARHKRSVRAAHHRRSHNRSPYDRGSYAGDRALAGAHCPATRAGAWHTATRHRHPTFAADRTDENPAGPDRRRHNVDRPAAHSRGRAARGPIRRYRRDRAGARDRVHCGRLHPAHRHRQTPAAANSSAVRW